MPPFTGAPTSGFEQRAMTQILPRSTVSAAVERALSLAPDLEAAIHAAAQALGLDVEAVQECWGEQEQPA